jgi:hypothetical protein
MFEDENNGIAAIFHTNATTREKTRLTPNESKKDPNVK